MAIKKILDTRQCINCRADIIRRENTENANVYCKRRFCSRYCFNEHRVSTKTQTVQCLVCEKKFKRGNYHSSLYKNSYCSLNCFNLHKPSNFRTIVKCAFCGSLFKKQNRFLNTKMHFCNSKCAGKWQSENAVGRSGYNYKGRGTWSAITHRIRKNSKNIDWRRRVFERDKFTCQYCGDHGNKNLNAHHIKNMSEILKQYKIRSTRAAVKNKELWDINNGVTLCKDCHKIEHELQKLLKQSCK